LPEAFNHSNSSEMDKLSINKCRNILNSNGNKYTDEEIEKIRDFFYILGEIDFNNFQKHVAQKKQVEQKVSETDTKV
jgi:hypothetical protein